MKYYVWISAFLFTTAVYANADEPSLKGKICRKGFSENQCIAFEHADELLDFFDKGHKTIEELEVSKKQFGSQLKSQAQVAQKLRQENTKLENGLATWISTAEDWESIAMNYQSRNEALKASNRELNDLIERLKPGAIRLQKFKEMFPNWE
jgi:cell division protein FtsB